MQLRFKSKSFEIKFEHLIKNILFVEDDFKSNLDLQLACLILDQQVKIINGNEANILVPGEWLKQYLEDQERGVHQPEPQKPQNFQIQSMDSIFS